MKQLKLRQAVQGPLRRRWTFWIMRSLSLVQQCALPKNWPFFRSRTNDNTAQCPTHGNAFLRLYVNDYNCNKSRVGTCFSRLVPLITQQQYILPRDIAQTLPGTHSPWLILCWSYLRKYALGNGQVKLLQPWGKNLVFTYSQQPVQKHIMPCLS